MPLPGEDALGLGAMSAGGQREQAADTDSDRIFSTS